MIAAWRCRFHGLRFRVVAAALVAVIAGCGDEESAGPDRSWPKRMTLASSAFGTMGEAYRLIDGKPMADGGDIALFLGVQLSLLDPRLSSPGVSRLFFCAQGRYATLAEVPTDFTSCPGTASGEFTERLFLSAAVPHIDENSDVVGLGSLVEDAESGATYRLRVLGDTVSLLDDGFLGRATATFEYEPLR